MRVLHFLPVYAPAWQFGGPVLSVSRLCEALVQQGVDVRVITTNAGLPDIPIHQHGVPQNINGVEVIYYPVDQKPGTIRSMPLVKALPQHMNWADLLHLSSIWQPLGIPVQRAAHAFEVPVIQTLRGALGPYSWSRGSWKKIPYFYLKERPLLQRSSMIHCTTEQEARETSWLRLKPSVQVLPNPIDLSQLHYNPSAGKQWRIQNDLPIFEPLLLVAGRLHHKKGLDLLPKALRELADNPWQIVFVGKDDDGSGASLRRKFEEEGLNKRCHWYPALPANDLMPIYNAADWLLLPSRHENFGNVAVEALSCGCGAVLTDRVGVADSLAACPGVLIAERTKLAWIEVISRALTMRRPGSAGEEWVKSRFSSHLIALQYQQLYSLIINPTNTA